MNRSITSFEVQDYGDKEFTPIVRGERINHIMFEQQFDYNDKDKHSLHLHLLEERFIEEFPKYGYAMN